MLAANVYKSVGELDEATAIVSRCIAGARFGVKTLERSRLMTPKKASKSTPGDVSRGNRGNR